MNRNFHSILKASAITVTVVAFTTSLAGLLYFGIFQKSTSSLGSAEMVPREKLSDNSQQRLGESLRANIALSKLTQQQTQKSLHHSLIPVHAHTSTHLSSISSGAIDTNSSFPVIFILTLLGLTTAGALGITQLLLWLGERRAEDKKLEDESLEMFDSDSFGTDEAEVINADVERDWILHHEDSILDLVFTSATGQALLDSFLDLKTLKQEINQANSQLLKQITKLEEKNLEAETPIAYLLSEDHWQWNDWREQHRDQAVSLAGITLAIKSLRYFDLSHVNLSNATLVAVDFTGANLAHADLSGANLARSSFVSANLSFADLRQTNLQHSNFYLTDLSYAQLDGADCNGCSMPSVNLLGASLVDAVLTSADLSCAMLKSANLTQAQACFAQFESTDFTGAILVRVNLSHSNFNWTKFAGADVSGTNFTSAAFDKTRLLLAMLHSKEAVDSNTWRYDSATNFEHTLFSSKD